MANVVVNTVNFPCLNAPNFKKKRPMLVFVQAFLKHPYFAQKGLYFDFRNS